MAEQDELNQLAHRIERLTARLASLTEARREIFLPVDRRSIQQRHDRFAHHQQQSSFSLMLLVVAVWAEVEQGEHCTRLAVHLVEASQLLHIRP